MINATPKRKNRQNAILTVNRAEEINIKGEKP